MQLDIKKAFLSPFSDKKWYQKLIFPIFMTFLISLIGGKILPQSYNGFLSVISIVSFLILSGYYIQFQHNEIHGEHPLLPNPKSKKMSYMKFGFFGAIISIFYLIAGFLLMISPQAMAPFEVIFIDLSHASPISMHAIMVISVVSVVVTTFIGALLFISWMFSLNAYADYLEFNENVDFIRSLKMMSSVKWETFIFALIAVPIDILIMFLPQLLDMAKAINGLFIIAVVFIVLIQLIEFNLGAQLYKIAKNKLENIAQKI